MTSVRRIWLGLAACLASSLALGGWVDAASADVVQPPGACTGSAHWTTSGLDESSAEHQPSDVIDVPRADVVQWTGSIGDATPDVEGPRREIDGNVQLHLPVGKATIDSWSGSSVRYANSGEHDYDLPMFLSGLKLKLSGVHRDGGVVTCSGSVYVRIDGGAMKNPVTFVAAGGLALSGFGLFVAGRPRMKGGVS